MAASESVPSVSSVSEGQIFPASTSSIGGPSWAAALKGPIEEDESLTKRINPRYLEPRIRYESLESRFASVDDQQPSQIWGIQL